MAVSRRGMGDFRRPPIKSENRRISPNRAAIIKALQGARRSPFRVDPNSIDVAPFPGLHNVPHGAQVPMGAPGGIYRKPPMVNPLPGHFEQHGDNPTWVDPYDTDPVGDYGPGPDVGPPMGFPGKPQGFEAMTRPPFGGRQQFDPELIMRILAMFRQGGFGQGGGPIAMGGSMGPY